MTKDAFICNKCKTSYTKQEGNFWMDNRPDRKRFRATCKDCGNKYKRLKRKVDFENVRFIPSELKHKYKIEIEDPELLEIRLNKLSLAREINKMRNEPIIVSDQNKIIIFCPNCGTSEKLNTPFHISAFGNLVKLFNLKHDGKTCKGK